MHKFAKRKVSSWFHLFLARSHPFQLDILWFCRFKWTILNCNDPGCSFGVSSLCVMQKKKRDLRSWFTYLIKSSHLPDNPLDSTFLLTIISLQTEGKTHGKQKLSGSFDDYFGHESFEVELLLELRTSRLWCRIQKYKGLKPSRYHVDDHWTRINPFKSQNPIKLKQQMTVTSWYWSQLSFCSLHMIERRNSRAGWCSHLQSLNAQ